MLITVSFYCAIFPLCAISVNIHYQVIFTPQRMELTVKELATIELDEAAPERAPSILAALPRIKVRHGKRQAIWVNGTSYPLKVFAGLAPYDHLTSDDLARRLEPDQIPLVVAHRLTLASRQFLEKLPCSYADATGAVHLEGPGFLIHLDPATKPTQGAIPAPRGLGVVAVRAIQVLLSEPERRWSVTDLAETAQVSAGEAHKVLTRLEIENLVIVANNRRRKITHPTDLLDWLATVPAARKTHGRLGGYLYAPKLDDLLTRLAFNANRSETAWAITGAAAAMVMGAQVVTALPTTLVRVPAKPGLVAAAANLGVDPVDSGANLMLIADVGDLGTRQANHVGPLAVAPPVRIWLDMLSEPRGEDAAALFREAVLGY